MKTKSKVPLVGALAAANGALSADFAMTLSRGTKKTFTNTIAVNN